LAQRNRKRGRRQRPVGGTATATRPAPSQQRARPSGEEKDAAVRATLRPIAEGERPLSIAIAAGIAALVGAGNLIAYLAGAKIGGKHPAAGGIILFSLLMLMCAAGLWRLRYWAVLGFMVLLAIIVVLFTLLLVEASNLLGFVVPPVIIAGSSWLFLKLVRVLSRIQMPQYPGR
jgi:hypothetical protein